MKGFLSNIAEKWQLVSEAQVIVEADYEKIEQALEQSTIKPSVYEDFNLDDVEDF